MDAGAPVPHRAAYYGRSTFSSGCRCLSRRLLPVPFPDTHGAIRNCDAADHPGDTQLSSNARTTGLGPSVLMQIKAEFEVLF